MTLEDIKHKDFKWDWTHDEYYSEELCVNEINRKCNCCGIIYEVGLTFDMFQNVSGIKLFGNYKMSSIICDHCGMELIKNGKLSFNKKDSKPIQMSFFGGMEY